MKDPYENYPTGKYGKIKTRPYQQYAIDKAIESFKTSELSTIEWENESLSLAKPMLTVASVSSGKTIMIAALCKHVTDRGGRVLVLSRQAEIIEQDSIDCWLAECKNSLYSASLGKKSTVYPVVMGTEGTVSRALLKDLAYWNNDDIEPSEMSECVFDLVLIDEVQHVDFESPTSQYMVIIKELVRRNPKVRIHGLTGTDYRGITPIVGSSNEYLWRGRTANISQEYLTGMGYLMPCVFGFGEEDAQYDLSEWKSDGNQGTKDFTAKELQEMESAMLKAETTTEKIIIDLVAKTKSRNGVLITCSGKRHCKEAARFLPKGSYAIITDDMSSKSRRNALKKAYDGDIKYVLQINALTTGVNCPIWDTIVILRKIGSLTLLVQLIGRGLRLLKPEQVSAGIKKEDCLVLDYSDTMSDLHDLYENPLLDEADLSKSRQNQDTITCPKENCQTENGAGAVRCRGEHGGVRCDFFFKSRLCEPFYVNGVLKDEGCGAENAPTARQCRICGNTLIDPNEKLSGKHYTANDFVPVNRMQMIPCKNDGVLIIYMMANGEEAKIFHNPFSKNQIAKRIWNAEFVKHHAITPQLKKKVRAARNAGELCQLEDELNTVAAITHRTNDKGKSVIAKYINK